MPDRDGWRRRERGRGRRREEGRDGACGEEAAPDPAGNRDGDRGARRAWEYTTKASVGRPASFSCHEFEPGVPTRGEIMFEVPQAEANRLLGVRLQSERDWRYRSIVLRPPTRDEESAP